MENHIFIYSTIGSEDGDISLEAVKNQYNPSSKKVVVHINSPGGEVSEGRAIFDFLREIPQTIHTIGEGMVASIATLPFLAGETREMKPNCEFLAHLPSIGVEGNSDDIERVNEYMQQKKRDIAGVYSQYTGKSIDEMVEFMRQDIPISAQKAKDLGFVTFIPDFKAVAKFNIQTDNKMENKKTEETLTKLDVLQNKIVSVFDKMVETLDGKQEAKKTWNMNVELEDGAMIYVDSEDGEFEGKVAFKLDADGNISEDFVEAGSHALKDGRVLIVGADGVIEGVDEVVEADAEKEEMQNKIKELEAKLEGLNATNETLTNEKKELETSKDKMAEDISELKTATADVMNEIKAFRTMTAGGEAEVAKANIKPESKTPTKQIDKKADMSSWAKGFLTNK